MRRIDQADYNTTQNTQTNAQANKNNNEKAKKRGNTVDRYEFQQTNVISTSILTMTLKKSRKTALESKHLWPTKNQY